MEIYKLCVGPMSKNIVDAIIEMQIPMILIPSRRQIEMNGGYVNNWTTVDFCTYVRNRSDLILIERDHGGPGQGNNDDDGIESLMLDAKYMDILHIDPWKKYPKYEDGLVWTLKLIRMCLEVNPHILFEVGTEEAIRKIEYDELERFLSDLRIQLGTAFKQIKYCVIQCGTSLRNGQNNGKFDSHRLQRMIEVCRRYNLLSKEHNGDWVNQLDLSQKFQMGLNAVNIAPEMGTFETECILNSVKADREIVDRFYQMCYASNKWVKWVSEGYNPTVEELIKICGHYIFSVEGFECITQSLPADFDNNVRVKIRDKLNVYLACIKD